MTRTHGRRGVRTLDVFWSNEEVIPVDHHTVPFQPFQHRLPSSLVAVSQTRVGHGHGLLYLVDSL